MLRYTNVATGPGRFIVVDDERGGGAIFDGVYGTDAEAARSAAILNREYEKWLRETAAARGSDTGAVL